MAGGYEIEIKSLLGDTANAASLVERMRALDPNLALRDKNTQLNHYFIGGDINALANSLKKHLTDEETARMLAIAQDGTDISLRTRKINDEVRIVLKASLGEDSSANGVIRAELDVPVSGLSLDELDQIVLDAGYAYQAKWSRERQEYALGNTSVCIDKNAGYGHVAEFERVIENAAEVEDVRAELLELMKQLGVEELAQDRLERMFAHYNAHWPEYYGTSNMFFIE